MNKQSGFTLIEIIAVLVILGILAAVAIPKYQDLQKEAGKKAATGIVGAAISQMTMEYSRALLASNGNTTVAEAAVTGSCNNMSYDTDQFTITKCEPGTNGIVVKHLSTEQTANGTWIAP